MDILNDNQRELVKNNHNLIYSYLHSHGLDVEEWYDIAAIGLCNAAMTYKDDVAKFTTYAYKCIRSQISHELKRLNAEIRGKNEPPLYYDATRELDNEGHMTCLLNAIKDNRHDTSRQAVLRVDLDNAISTLNDREKLTVRLIINGKNRKEIERKVNRSRTWISNLQKQIRVLCDE